MCVHVVSCATEMEQQLPPPPIKRRTERQARDEQRWNALSTLAALDALDHGNVYW